MTDPNDPKAEAPGPADAPTGPAPVAWTDPVAPPPPPAAAPPSRWEPPSQARPGPAPGYVYVGFWRRFAAT
ncbi:MAG: hypothetical protein ACXWW6_04640, partial [Candidatus Limnocylindrales bacterium]